MADVVEILRSDHGDVQLLLAALENSPGHAAGATQAVLRASAREMEIREAQARRIGGGRRRQAQWRGQPPPGGGLIAAAGD
jgi:hypothetical protein